MRCRASLFQRNLRALFSFKTHKVAVFFLHLEILTSLLFFKTRAFEEMLRFLKEQLEIC